MRALATFVVVFAAATAITGVADSAIAVYWLRDFDPKFQDAPSAAFEVALWGTLAITLIGATAVAIAACFLRRRLSINRKSIIICCVAGVVYPVLGRLLAEGLESILSPEVLVSPVVDWAYLILFPVLAMLWIAVPSAQHKPHAA